MKQTTEKGSILLFVIAIILFISVIVLSFSNLVDRPGKYQTDEVAIDRAMHLAQSGVNWAAATMATIPETDRTIELFREKLRLFPYDMGDGEQGKIILTGFTQGEHDKEIWVNAKATVQDNTYTIDKRLWLPALESPFDKFVITRLGSKIILGVGNKVTGNIAVKELQMNANTEIQGSAIVKEDAWLSLAKIVDNPDTPEKEGDLCVQGKLKMESDSKIGGNVIAHEHMAVSASEITGNAATDGDMDLFGGGKIDGNAIAKGRLDMKTSKIEKNAHVGGDVTIDIASTIEGNLYTNGNVHISGKVMGDVHAKGSVSVHTGGKVFGNIYANGPVKAHGVGARVEGDIHSNCCVDIGLAAKIQGAAYAKGSITGTQNIEGAANPYYANPTPPTPPTLPNLQSCWWALCMPKLLAEDKYPPQDHGDVDFTSYKQCIELEPGSYGKIQISPSLGLLLPYEKQANNLFLKTGTYYFTEIRRAPTVPNLHIYLDLSDRQASPDYKGINIFFKGDADWQRQVHFFVRKDPGGPYYPLVKINKASHFDHVETAMGIDVATETTLSDADALELGKYVYMESRKRFHIIEDWDWLGTILANEIYVLGFSRWVGSYHSLRYGGVEDMLTTDIPFAPAEYITTPEGIKRWSCPK